MSLRLQYNLLPHYVLETSPSLLCNPSSEEHSGLAFHSSETTICAVRTNHNLVFFTAMGTLAYTSAFITPLMGFGKAGRGFGSVLGTITAFQEH